MSIFTVLLILAGLAFSALFLSPGFLAKVLKALRWSAPGVENELRPAQAVCFLAAFGCFWASVGFTVTAVATVVYFAWRFLTPGK